MTLGEKIQFYRKKSGMSQDELGRMLLVSRQTVSLWEMDKTMPTVDNLLRLKEIFGVSLDGLLGDCITVEPPTKKPLEVYEFGYSDSELNSILAKENVRFLLPMVFLIAVSKILKLLAKVFGGAPEGIIAAEIGIVIVWIVLLVKYFKFLASTRAWGKTGYNINEGTYLYELFDTYFILSITKNSERVRNLKIYYHEIEKQRTVGNYLILQVEGRGYIIKKDALADNSLLFSCNTKEGEKIKKKKPESVFGSVSIWLFVGSIVTLWMAELVQWIISEVNGEPFNSTWIYFLFVPVSLASLLFGLFMRKKGYAFRKNIIAGIIMTALLCVYGAYSFLSEDPRSDDIIPQVEQMLDIDIPSDSIIRIKNLTDDEQSKDRGYIYYYVGELYFEESFAKEFEGQVSQDPRWISELPTKLIGITCSYYSEGDYDSIVVYNVETDEFNKLPDENGKYRFINVLYDREGGRMKLVEYETEYIE